MYETNVYDYPGMPWFHGGVILKSFICNSCGATISEDEFDNHDGKCRICWITRQPNRIDDKGRLPQDYD